MILKSYESALFFHYKRPNTVFVIEDRTVCIRCSGRNTWRLRVCVGIPGDGTKFFLFLIIKRQSGGNIENSAKMFIAKLP